MLGIVQAICIQAVVTATRPKFHFTPRFGWTNDPNGLNFAPGSGGKLLQHLYYQANPNSTGSPWSGGPANCPAWWGHATSTFGQPGALMSEKAHEYMFTAVKTHADANARSCP